MDCVEGKRKSDFCQLCSEENKSSKADGVCRECQEFMCQTCYQHHLKARVCRTHVLLDPRDTSSTIVRDIEKCEKHVSETVRFYCRKHDQVGCGDCMLFDGHRSCQPVYIKDVSSNFRRSEEFKRLTNKLETLESDNGDVIKKVRDNVESNKEMNDKLVADVKSFRKRIDDYFDKAEAENLTFIEKKCSHYSNSLKQLETDCNGISAELEEHKQKLTDESYTDSVLFIHSVVAKSKLQQLDSSIKQADLSCKFYCHEFKPDKQLLEVLSKYESLGSFVKEYYWSATCLESKHVPTTENIGKTEREPNNIGAKISSVKSKVTNQNTEANFEGFRIFMEFRNRITSYIVYPSDTISTLKETISEEENLWIGALMLTLPSLGIKLRDDFLISDYIEPGTTIYLTDVESVPMCGAQVPTVV